MLADSNALEYPVNPAVAADPPLKPLRRARPADVDIGTLNGPQVIDDDAAGRAALSTVTPAPRPADAAGAPPDRRPAAAARCCSRRSRWRCSRWSRSGFVVVVHRQHRARPRRGTCWSGRASASCSGNTVAAGRRLRRAQLPVLGVGAAWLVERTDLPGRRAVARAAGRAAGGARVRQQLRLGLAHPRRARATPARVLIVTLSYFPLVYLPVAATLRGLDPALEETAYSLGLGRWRGVLRGWCCRSCGRRCSAAALLVALHLLAEFGALQMLRFPTFTTAIYDQYQSTFNGPAATMLAGVLVLLLPAPAARRAAAARPPPLRAGRRAARARPAAPAPARPAALAGRWPGSPRSSCCRSACRSAACVHWLLVGSSTGVPARRAGLGGRHVARPRRRRGAALTVAARAARWPGSRCATAAAVSTLLERSTYIANALPGIVVALALVTVSIRVVPAALPDRAAAARRLRDPVPAAGDGQRPGRARAGAAGARRRRAQPRRTARSATLRRVTLPLIAPGLGAGAALVFLAVVTELTATLLLAPIGTAHAGHRVLVADATAVAYGAAAPYAAADGADLGARDVPAQPRQPRAGRPR